jgi:arginine deiminase
MKFIFTFHKELKTPESIIDLHEISTEGAQLTLEGGDFLVLDSNTVAIAWSKRTTLKSIQLIAKQLKNIGVENLIVAKLPHKTSFIHLDTVFTRINHHEALIYPPLFALESIDRAEILHYDLTVNELKSTRHHYLFDLLKDLGIDLRPVYCGGKQSLIDQKREQWTQGSNSVCIAPGIILTYARNSKTIQELSENGYLCISAKEILKSSFSINFNQKMAILLDGDELCRARGGPRCLTHPLVRE